jgi:hypothetical protein
MVGDITRKTVPLTEREAELIARARTAGTPENEALIQLAGLDVVRSEAATLHALVAFGLTTLGEQIAFHDYGRLAESRDAEDEAYETTARRRPRDRR